MLLVSLDFLDVSIADVLDILMVAVILFFIFKWVKNSSAMNIFYAILLLLIVRIVVSALGMKMMEALLIALLDVGLIAFLVIFQPEIRQSLNNLGMKASSGRKTGFLRKLLGGKTSTMSGNMVDEITAACAEMGEQKTGALIVLIHRDSLLSIINTGDTIDANINKRLIMNIFFKNSPLHDGAMIIAGNRIVAARCTLPITDRADIPAHYGMRHKAAIGISERSDADVIVVSEQTGHITFFRAGQGSRITNINTLKLLLEDTQDGDKA